MTTINQDNVRGMPPYKRKKTYLWALPGVGLLHGAVYSYGLSNPSTQAGLNIFITFTFNLALLGWCYADSEERKIPITRYLGLALVALAMIGVPWYFVRSRGFLGAAKAVFGFGLIGLWWLAMSLSFLVCEIVTGNFQQNTN